MEPTSDPFIRDSVHMEAPDNGEAPADEWEQWHLPYGAELEHDEFHTEQAPESGEGAVDSWELLASEPESAVTLGVDEQWYLPDEAEAAGDDVHAEAAPDELLDEEPGPLFVIAEPGPVAEAVLELERAMADEESEDGVGARPGVSPIAVQANKQWDAADRPKPWIGRVYGLVVHTTGGGLPASAQDKGVYHTVRAVDHYTGSHGCHYVNGWRGMAGGDLLQVANEREQAAGVGVTNPKEPGKDQRRSIELGRFEADLPPVLVRLWRARWPGRGHSLELLPGTRTANACYVHVECVPCVYHYRRKLITADGAQPLRPGLRFTAAQHETVAALACDIARRNGWPADEQWWRTPRLVGHEDLTPISRHDRLGGWDPGWLREKPYFDFDAVYQAIERIQRGGPGAPALPSGSQPPSIFGALGTVIDRFRGLLATGHDLAAVALARQRGVHDVNQLTNLVFFGRHPELAGRKLRSSETALATEWLRIRDTIVRPTAGSPR